jgi:hypothetical protein
MEGAKGSSEASERTREAGVDAPEGRVRYDGEHRVVICLMC